MKIDIFIQLRPQPQNDTSGKYILYYTVSESCNYLNMMIQLTK